MESETDGALLAAALDLAARGIPVFPCAQSKKPLISRGFLAATTDEMQIHNWWARWPNALIGVPTGKVSGLEVVDLDVRDGRDGIAAFEALRDGREIHSGPVVRTVSGGRHLYLRASGEGTVRCNIGRLAPGIDVRAKGGYVIVPPSPGYMFERHGELQPPPPWLLTLLNPPRCFSATRPPRRPVRLDNWLSGLVRATARAPEGRRNEMLFWTSCRLAEAVRAGRLSEAVASAIAEEAGQLSGLPVLEVRRTIESAFRTVLEGSDHD